MGQAGVFIYGDGIALAGVHRMGDLWNGDIVFIGQARHRLKAWAPLLVLSCGEESRREQTYQIDTWILSFILHMMMSLRMHQIDMKTDLERWNSSPR